MTATEQELESRTQGHRVLALDALRGVAAFVVIWHHLRFCFYLDEPRWWLRPLFAGRSAVVLFFVLSGYVLAMPYWRGSQPSYGRYLLRRFFRIYVPYAAAAVIALAAASHLLYSRLPLTPWFFCTWQTALTPQVIASQFFLPGSSELNTAFWSLRYEMEMSIIFPVVCWCITKLRGLGSFVFAAALETAGTLMLKVPAHSQIFEGLAQTLLWGSCFFFGALLSFKTNQIGRVYDKMPRWTKAALLVPIICAYFSGKTSLIPVAACGVLIFAQRSRVARLLEMAVPEYLGRISYSMYLIHGTVLWATMILLYGKVAFPLLVAIYCCVTIVASNVFCILVEEPAMRLGKSLTRPKARAESLIVT